MSPPPKKKKLRICSQLMVAKEERVNFLFKINMERSTHLHVILAQGPCYANLLWITIIFSICADDSSLSQFCLRM